MAFRHKADARGPKIGDAASLYVVPDSRELVRHID